MLKALVRGLSQKSRYYRFASAMPELPARMLARYTLIYRDRKLALVAAHRHCVAGPDGGVVETEQIIGVSRCITNPDQTRPDQTRPVESFRWWWPTRTRAKAWAWALG